MSNLVFSRYSIIIKFYYMSSYRQHLYHIVFRTKDSLPTIRQNNAHELYSYITGITKQKNSHLYRINGVENHLHILTDMNPSIAPIDFVKDIKVSSSIQLLQSWKVWWSSTPGCARGYSYLALSEPVIPKNRFTFTNSLK